MIIFTKQGRRDFLPDLAAYDGGVYVFPFFGDETYTDPADSSVWTWEGVTNDVEEVLGVSQAGNPLISTVSVSDCKALDGSFFWDDTEGYLYIHWNNSVGDWSVEKEENRFAQIVNGYASGYDEATGNVYDGKYYKPIITGISGLGVSVDPTKLGLIGFDSSSLTLADEEGEFTDVDQENIVGVPIWNYYVEEGKTTLENEDRIFTGFLNGLKHNRIAATYDVIQSRLFENKPVCGNTIELSEWPDADDQEGQLKPVAWGDVRRGKVVPVNGGALTTSSAGSAVLLLADPELESVIAITKIYDEEDNEITIDSSDLVACTATITKAAGVSVSNLKKYKWEGQGYDIVGTYNNGLDIIKDAFLKIASIPFLESTYDVGQWNDQTILNDEPVGISLQSDKGFVEDLIEPIMTSLQGSMQTLGDGRISFFSKDFTADPSEYIPNYVQVSDPTIEESTKEVVSEILVEYSPDFVAKESLQVIVGRQSVIGKYGIDRREPISPLKTLLVNESDSITTADDIFETSANPQRMINVTKTTVNKDINIFDIVKIDTGEYNQEKIEYGDLLKIEPNYLGKTQSYLIRIIPDYIPPETIRGFEHSNGSYNSVSHGIDGHGIFEIRRSS